MVSIKNELGYNICRVVGSRLGTNQSDDTREKIRRSKVGKHNPMYGKRKEQCHNAKLTYKLVGDIRDWLQYWPQISQVTIGKMYSVSDNHIGLIRRGLAW